MFNFQVGENKESNLMQEEFNINIHPALLRGLDNEA